MKQKTEPEPTTFDAVSVRLGRVLIQKHSDKLIANMSDQLKDMIMIAHNIRLQTCILTNIDIVVRHAFHTWRTLLYLNSISDLRSYISALESMLVRERLLRANICYDIAVAKQRA